MTEEELATATELTRAIQQCQDPGKLLVALLHLLGVLPPDLPRSGTVLIDLPSGAISVVAAQPDHRMN